MFFSIFNLIAVSTITKSLPTMISRLLVTHYKLFYFFKKKREI